ncbi:ecto-ADP-ribosyltransferase 5 [Xenopus tropicalis]|uniref:NAD(P)(+)--arginine ADP-ribosyltransferase n=1 Tax=Xenopus tropicalis TaxID=8364 RepID=A0A8J0QYS3_XENTR|nr:ecto-ADP-ribosyltransferase 5 [Xenopus tropicalis]|eukprot:XP_002942759.2 PREDICTED: ecto-ADP-ribosyltransferase 5-like [Xenopus tropicalis]
MSSDAFDDQYETCAEEMESRILQGGLLNQEKQGNLELNKAWNEAAEKWASMKGQVSVPKGFRDEYGVAILVYTNNQSKVYYNFNEAVRSYGSKNGGFPYHSLHFFLTRAVQLLRSSCYWKPWWVYRGMKNIHFRPEENIRFGQFSSSSTDKKVALGFGNHSFFTITSCFGVDIGRFSYFPDQKEVLIPVDEVFKVISTTKQGDSNQHVLETTRRRCHHYNCHYLSGFPKIFPCPSGSSNTHIQDS